MQELQKAQLFLGHCRSQRSHCIVQLHLFQSKHIHGAFHQIGFFCFSGLLLGSMIVENQISFFVDIRFRSVDILCFFIFRNPPGCKADRFSEFIMNRNHDTMRKHILHSEGGNTYKTCGHKIIIRMLFGMQEAIQGVIHRIVADFKALDNFFRNIASHQIFLDVFRIQRIQLIMGEFNSLPACLMQCLQVRILYPGGDIKSMLQSHTGILGNLVNRLDKGYFFIILYKHEYIAACSAHKAFVNLFIGSYGH